MSRVRIGFLGAGTMGQMAHLRNYATMSDCDVVALAELRPRTARRVAEVYGIPSVYADHREMLDKEELDGVAACQPFQRHAVLLPEVYPHVRHVFTEKPLAVGVEAAERLVAEAAEAGCTHMVGYNKRCDPATIHARAVMDDWLATGRMGPLRYVRLTIPNGEWIAEGFAGLIDEGEPVPELATEPTPADLDAETAKAHVAFINYYVHQVNLLRHLLGEPYTLTHVDPTGVLLAARGDSGIPGTIEMNPYRTTVAWEESALIAFEKGYLLLRLPAPMAVNRPGSLEIYTDPGDGTPPQRTTPTLPWIHSMRRQAELFIQVCRGQAAPPCAAPEAAADVRICRDYIRLRYGE